MSLFSEFQNNTGRRAHKWSHYFPIYERYFSQWRNKSLFFLEIGVSNGGSLQMWQRYFGPYAKIVGIDINPQCKEVEQDGIFVRIGDQSDEKFLKELVEEFDVPDIVLDDGSHIMKHVNATFEFLYPKMGKNAIYMVEDMQTAYWEEYEGGADNPGTFVNICKGYIDEMNAAYSRGKLPQTELGKSTMSIAFYDAMVVLEKGDIFWKGDMRSGKTKIKKPLRVFKQTSKPRP